MTTVEERPLTKMALAGTSGKVGLYILGKGPHNTDDNKRKRKSSKSKEPKSQHPRFEDDDDDGYTSGDESEAASKPKRKLPKRNAKSTESDEDFLPQEEDLATCLSLRLSPNLKVKPSSLH